MTAGPTGLATSPVAGLLQFIEARGRSSAQTARMRKAMGVPVTPLDLHTLVAIDRMAPLTVGELAEALEMTLPRASRQATRLHGMGLVQREADPEDLRSVRLRLSPTGTAARQRWRQEWLADYLAAAADWSPADRAAFGRHLIRLRDSLSAQPALRSAVAVRSPARAGTQAPGGPPDLREILPEFIQWAAFTVTNPAYGRAMLAAAGSPVPRQATVVLREISRRGPLDITELAGHLALDGSVVSRQCGTLTAHHLVRRAPDERDARRSILHPTPAGTQLLQALDLAQSGPVVAALQDWDAADLNECLDLLGRFVERLVVD